MANASAVALARYVDTNHRLIRTALLAYADGLGPGSVESAAQYRDLAETLTTLTDAAVYDDDDPEPDDVLKAATRECFFHVQTRYGDCEGDPTYNVVYHNRTKVLESHAVCFKHGLAEVERHHAANGMAEVRMVEAVV